MAPSPFSPSSDIMDVSERRSADKGTPGQETHLAPREITVGGRTYDLAKEPSEDALRNRIHELEQEEAKLWAARSARASRQDIEADLAEINGKLKEIEPNLVLGHKTTIEAAEKEIADWKNELEGKTMRLTEFRTLAQYAGKDCGICDLVSCNANVEMVKNAVATYQDAANDAEKKLKKAREGAKNLLGQDSVAQEASTLRQERNRLTTELEATGAEDNDALEAVQEKLRLNREIREKLRAWQHRRAAEERAERAKDAEEK